MIKNFLQHIILLYIFLLYLETLNFLLINQNFYYMIDC